MHTFIQLSAEERSFFCRQAAERLPIPLPPAVIEKDFWVCWILKELNELPALNEQITFKGGTSLSKAWGLIERFSEDIDIAVNRKIFGQHPPNGPEHARSNRQRKLRLDSLAQKSNSFILEVIVPQLTVQLQRNLNPDEFHVRPRPKGNEVNIEFKYPGKLKNELGGLLPVVLIELVARADEIPNEKRKITPLLFDVYSEFLGDGSFYISTLAPERTFLEKLVLIHETLTGFKMNSERKSRHFYDLFKLHQAGIFENIKENRALFAEVIKHRQTFFRYNKIDYDGILTTGIQITPTDEKMPDWRVDYARNKAMFFNRIPSFEELMEFTQQLEMEFNSWVLRRE